jgi:hypothetical protein
MNVATDVLPERSAPARPRYGVRRLPQFVQVTLVLAALAALAFAAFVMAPTILRMVRGAHCESSGAARGHADAVVRQWAGALANASTVGEHGGLRVGLAVLDTESGTCVTAGDTDGEFATASVVKVMIAAYLLQTGQMTGDTAQLAYSMITRSDDDAADQLWGLAGGARLEPWIEKTYDLPGLGSANSIPGRWGNTHVTASGLARLYAQLKADVLVWPWLGDAMHHMARTAMDGTDQSFGIPSVVSGAAVKQGWAGGSADDPHDAVVNSTGYVNDDRYVVVVLSEGHNNTSADDTRGFNRAQAAIVTDMARLLDLNRHS